LPGREGEEEGNGAVEFVGEGGVRCIKPVLNVRIYHIKIEEVEVCIGVVNYQKLMVNGFI